MALKRKDSIECKNVRPTSPEALNQCQAPPISYRWTRASIEIALTLKSPISPHTTLEACHGHSLQIQVGWETCEGESELQKSHQQEAFEKALATILEELEGSKLNHTLDPYVPTAEKVCLWLYRRLTEQALKAACIKIEDTFSSGIELRF